MLAEIIIIAILSSIACVIPGTFLLLKRMALISDAISHSILPGIVIGFFVKNSLNTPYPVIGAIFFAMIMVVVSEALHRSNLVKGDTAIAVVFPPLFSIGVILVSLFAHNVHLDTDAVLLGELAFAPLTGWTSCGRLSLSMVKMGIILILNLIVMLLLFKELKVSTFDPVLSQSLGFSPLPPLPLNADDQCYCSGGFRFSGGYLSSGLHDNPNGNCSSFDKLPLFDGLDSLWFGYGELYLRGSLCNED